MNQVGRVGIAGVVALALATSGCGSKSKTSSTSSSGSTAPASSVGPTVIKHYRAGEFCSAKKTAVYASQQLTCVNGHLKKK